MSGHRSRFGFDRRYALRFGMLLCAEAGIAVFVDDRIVRPYGGDILVVVLVYCAARTVWMRPIRALPEMAFVFASWVEVTQYFHLIDRLGLTENAVARAFLGTVFDPGDFLCYAVGLILVRIALKLKWLPPYPPAAPPENIESPPGQAVN